MNEKKDTDTVTKEIQSKQETKSFPLPWDRFWARCIDLPIHYLILFLILILPGISSCITDLTPIAYSSKKVLIAAWAIISVEFILYESIFLSTLGATPGKILFRIKVTGNDGRKLSFTASLTRALYVYCFGHYLFVFQEIFIIAYIFSGRYFKKAGTFKWDKACNSVVSQELLNPLRKTFLILLAIICLTLRLSPALFIIYKIITYLEML